MGTAATLDWSTANEGSQLPFITDTVTRHTAFVGGLGSGKTWSGAMKTLLYATAYPGALMLVCAPTYRQLRDSTLREFFKLLPKQMISNWNKSEYELKLVNGTEILFRSLENYENIRGVEVAFIWIDEANLVSFKAWKVAIGRLRQPKFPHRSCITTTPRGKTLNWVYEQYVKSVENGISKNRKTYNATTRDNVANIGEEYVADLETTYTGDFALQELHGQFVDIIEGRVYQQFSREWHVDYFGEQIIFEPHRPLYGLWDYGISDQGALWLAQTADIPEHDSIPIVDRHGELKQHRVPARSGLFLVDLILEDGQNVDFWIETVRAIEKSWKPIDKHWGDPAGEQRTVTTGKSMAEHLRGAGIIVRSKKQSTDRGRLIVHKLLNEQRIFINSECEMGIAAFTNYHWPLDADGNRKAGSRQPVHDWSSNPMDALRYGVTGLFPVISASKLDERNLGQVSHAPRAGSFIGIKKETWG